MTFNIVCFSSGGPGNFATVLDFCDRTRGCDVSLLIADRDKIPSLELAQARKIPHLVVPIEGTLNFDCAQSVATREAELAPIYQALLDHEREVGHIDLIVLAFRKVLCGPILEHFKGRMINVHPADLSVMDVETRKPRYVGIDGLARSIRDGNRTTRTSVHHVTSGVDEGPLICLGPEVPFVGDAGDPTHVMDHEIQQKVQSDRPCLTQALAICTDPNAAQASTFVF